MTVVTIVIFGMAACRAEPESRHLPSLRQSEVVRLKSGVPISLVLRLEPGWKINDAAPSWASFFSGKDLVREFTREQLKKGGIYLPALEPGISGHFRGTFYFCERDQPTVCVQQSCDQGIQAESEGGATLTIELHR